MKRRIALITIFLFMVAASSTFADVLGDLAQTSVDLSLEYGCVAEHSALNAPSSDSDGGFQINASSEQKIATISLPVGGSDYEITISSDCNYKHEDDNFSVRPFGIDAVLYLEYEGNIILSGYGGIGETGNHNGEYNVGDEIKLTVNGNLANEFSNMEPFEFFTYTLSWEHRDLWLPVLYLLGVYHSLPDEMKNTYEEEFGFFDSWLAPYKFMLEEYFNQTPTGARLELYLVLPSLENKENQMLYAGNNEYSSTISVTGNGANEKITISGNYTDVTERIECSLTIASNDNADVINLNSMDPKNSDASSSIDIGTYIYGIDITSLNQDVGFYAFLSSSNNSAVSGGEFTLSNDNYSFTYEAGISEENGLEEEIKWYDGSDTFSSIQTDESNMFNLGVSDYSTNGATRSFSGDGKILFRLTDKTRKNFDSILPGTYTSTIYFHVVADL